MKKTITKKLLDFTESEWRRECDRHPPKSIWKPKDCLACPFNVKGDCVVRYRYTKTFRDNVDTLFTIEVDE